MKRQIVADGLKHISDEFRAGCIELDRRMEEILKPVNLSKSIQNTQLPASIEKTSRISQAG